MHDQTEKASARHWSCKVEASEPLSDIPDICRLTTKQIVEGAWKAEPQAGLPAARAKDIGLGETSRETKQTLLSRSVGPTGDPKEYMSALIVFACL
jgi:hypothetical protein